MWVVDSNSDINPLKFFPIRPQAVANDIHGPLDIDGGVPAADLVIPRSRAADRARRWLRPHEPSHDEPGPIVRDDSEQPGIHDRDLDERDAAAAGAPVPGF
ncbi:MAG TPA: hypothetical protein VJX92_05235, partial [Methylomirabilota bacterium]|nr:hypothetical protein [Methylomirabilota bacterium]